MVTLIELILSMIGPKTSVISLVGAGGKSSLLFRICDRYHELNRENLCIATTSTHMYMPQDSRYTCRTFKEFDSKGPFPQFVYSRPASVRGKVKGISAEDLERLIDSERPGLIVCESDGSHRLPLKAPGPGEPVHPATVDLCIGLIGLSALGKPIDSRTVHRLPCFLEVTAASEGQRITSDVLRSLIEDRKQGLFKDLNPEVPTLVLLNQAEMLNQEARAELALALEGLDVSRLCIASVLEDHIYYLSE